MGRIVATSETGMFTHGSITFSLYLVNMHLQLFFLFTCFIILEPRDFFYSLSSELTANDDFSISPMSWQRKGSRPISAEQQCISV